MCAGFKTPLTPTILSQIKWTWKQQYLWKKSLFLFKSNLDTASEMEKHRIDEMI